jgi:hypothetical protein
MNDKMHPHLMTKGPQYMRSMREINAVLGGEKFGNY